MSFRKPLGSKSMGKVVRLLIAWALVISCSQNKPLDKVQVKCRLINYACGDCSERYKVIESSVAELKGKELVLNREIWQAYPDRNRWGIVLT